jgi:outer membrane protein assembly factor BamB
MRNRVAASATIAGACILAAVIAPVPSVFAAGPGKQSEYAVAYQINPAHSGSINFSAGFTAPLTQIWSVNLDSSLSYPVVAEGKVFVNSSAGQTYALDLATGTTNWSANTGVTLGPAYDRGSLFLLNGVLLSSLRAESGESQWTTQLPYQSFSSSAPMAYKGQVFAVASENGGDVYGVDEKSGTVEWYEPVNGGDNSSPAYGDSGVYVVFTCQYYKFDAVTGVLDWNDNEGCNGGGGNTPVYYSKRVYVQDPVGGGDSYMLRADNGAIIGTFGATSGDPPAFWQFSSGKRFGFSLYDGDLYAWKVSTGTNVWRFTGDNQLSTPPIVINGLVVEGSGSGNVYLLDASTGRLEWLGSTGASVTALGAGQGELIVISGSIVTAYKPG